MKERYRLMRRGLRGGKFYCVDSTIRRSHCERCAVRAQCHEIFGKVDFGDSVVVGMFPFTTIAPHAMLQRLSEARYKSPRGLLVYRFIETGTY